MPFGQLGDIQFNYLNTPNRDSFNRSKISKHVVHDTTKGKGKVEPVNFEPDTMNFSLFLDYVWLGNGQPPYQEVRDALDELERTMERQEPILYAIGEKIYGDVLITDMTIREKFVTNDGILERVEIDVSLIEVA